MARFTARAELLEQRLLLSASSRLSHELAKLALSPGESSSFNTAFTRIVTDESGEEVLVEILVNRDVGAVVKQLTQLGASNLINDATAIAGYVPISALTAIADIPAIDWVTAPPPWETNAVANQADLSMRSDLVRSQFSVNGFPLDGEGVTIGIISTSFAKQTASPTAANDVANGDLPPQGTSQQCQPGVDAAVYCILFDPPGMNNDEGRAMAQLIHDVAPKAKLLFHAPTAFTTELGMQVAINALTNAGADIIVDDITVPFSGMFQETRVAQAVNSVVGQGVPYFTSAGNQSEAYESNFRVSGTDYFGAGFAHDFDPGLGVDTKQRLHVPIGASFAIRLQWDNPFKTTIPVGTGATSELNFLLLDENGQLLISNSDFALDIGDDPLSQIGFVNTTNSTNFDLVIAWDGGTAAPFFRYVLRELTDDTTITEFATPNAPTIYGHQNSLGTAVGAAHYHYGNRFTPSGLSPQLEHFSAIGGGAITRAIDGSVLSTPIVREKPEFVAPDGSNTSFFTSDTSVYQTPGNFLYHPGYLNEQDDTDSLPNFFGTSAAAPHAAAVAALIKQAWPQATPAEINGILQTTASDQGPAGYDVAWGHGLIDALSAVYKAFKPNPPDLTSTTLFDTGISQTDNITTHRRPEFRGTVPANSYVELFVDNETTPRKTVQLSNSATSYVLSLAQTPLLSEGDHFFKIRVAESASVPAANRSRFSDTLKVTVDLTGPKLAGFTTRNATETWAIVPQANSPQQILPVHLRAGLKYIDVPFGEPVKFLSGSTGVYLTGVNDSVAGDPPRYYGISYQTSSAAALQTITVTGANITGDQLYLQMVATQVTDVAGNALDGEWTNPTSWSDNTGNSAFASGNGNGSPGGDLNFAFTVFIGDTNGDGDVDLNDLNNVRNNFGNGAVGDTDWDGDTDLDDLNNVRNNFGLVDFDTFPAAPPPPGLMMMSGGNSGPSLAVGEERLRHALRDLYFARPSGQVKSNRFDGLFYWDLLGDAAWWKVTLGEA